MKDVLIIWDSFGQEELKFYLFALTPDQLAQLRKCHGNYVNSSNSPQVDDALDWLSELLTELTPLETKEPFKLASDDVTVVVAGFVP